MEYSQNWKKLKQDLQTGNIHARRQKRHNENGCGLERKKKKKQFKRDNLSSLPCEKKEKISTNKKQLKKSSHILKKELLNDFSSKENSNEVWFDTANPIVKDIVAAEQIGKAKHDSKEENMLVKSFASDELTKIIGMDCALVGVGEMKESVLARVSIVNRHGVCVYDKFVKTKEPIADYRTRVSGIKESDMKNAEGYEKVQQEVSDILLGRVLVGHSLYYSLKALFLTHPSKDTRDIARQSLFKSFSASRKPSLRVLCKKFLGIEIQKGRRNTIENAQAAMKLFIMHKRDWGHIRSKKRYKKVLARKQNSNGTS